MGNLPPLSLIPVAISPRIFEKIRNDANFIFRGLGQDDSLKNLKPKIAWHCPFKHINYEWLVSLVLASTQLRQPYCLKNSYTGIMFIMEITHGNSPSVIVGVNVYIIDIQVLHIKKEWNAYMISLILKEQNVHRNTRTRFPTWQVERNRLQVFIANCSFILQNLIRWDVSSVCMQFEKI